MRSVVLGIKGNTTVRKMKVGACEVGRGKKKGGKGLLDFKGKRVLERTLALSVSPSATHTHTHKVTGIAGHHSVPID